MMKSAANMLRLLLALIILLVLAGCSQSPRVRGDKAFDASQVRDTIYVLPFDATLVPSDFGEPLFNEFVDQLNEKRKATMVGRFAILKEDMKEVEPAWLIRQTYLSGDVWGFVENAGCCSSELKVKSRLYIYEQGKGDPVLDIFLPVDYFFEHDRMTLDDAKRVLSRNVARNLAARVIDSLTPKP